MSDWRTTQRPDVELFASPSDSSRVRRRLSSGTAIHVHSTRPGWLLVGTVDPAVGTGWVREGDAGFARGG